MLWCRRTVQQILAHGLLLRGDSNMKELVGRRASISWGFVFWVDLYFVLYGNCNTELSTWNYLNPIHYPLLALKCFPLIPMHYVLPPIHFLLTNMAFPSWSVSVCHQIVTHWPISFIQNSASNVYVFSITSAFLCFSRTLSALLQPIRFWSTQVSLIFPID